MFLGIDLGTSAVKACLLDDGGIVAQQAATLSLSHPFPGASEQVPEDWWAATCAAITALPAKLRMGVTGIGLSGQMHGAVLLDAARAPICPAILWNDARAEAECADLLAAAPEFGALAGVLPMAGFTSPKLLWLSRHRAELHSQIAHVILPKDYIGLCLHGGLITDPSDAAGTCWLDQRDGTWSDRLCGISATDPSWLPELCPGYEVAGRLTRQAADELGLPPGVDVVAGAGDAAAGAVGLGALTPGDAFLSLGTSGQLFVTSDEYRPNPERRLHAYAHTLPQTWFQMAAMLNGARPMAWLAEILDKPINVLLSEAEAAEPGPLFLPYLTGERTPHGDSDIRGGFAGLAEGTNRGSLMRAVVEAIAFSFVDAFEAMAKSGTKIDVALAIGGGTRSDFLLQMIADITQCRLLRSADADVGPALGAARLAAAAAGETALLHQKPSIEAEFVPKAPEASQRLDAYRALYPALKGVQGHLS